MPPKKKIPVGELTSAEIRKLIRAHNTIVKKNLLIKIPAGTTREGLIKLVEDKDTAEVTLTPETLPCNALIGSAVTTCVNSLAFTCPIAPVTSLFF